MQDPVILELIAYWERLRAGRIAPTRSEIDPREIRNALEHTFILEYCGPQNVRFRLAGTTLCDSMGMELRGMPARSVIAPKARNAFDTVLADLPETPRIVELGLQAGRPGHGSSARMLLLPMQDGNGCINRVLGCVTRSGTVQSTPQRFVITKQKSTRIISSQAVRQVTFAAGMAEPHPEYTPALTTPKPTETPVFHSFTGGKRPGPARTRKTRPNLRLVRDA
ncbi:MAG: PAS domain-containing protein [Rhodobacteraceae bacterium]|nr:PAS domain-containing protein [Paracoccaceae bacterium]